MILNDNNTIFLGNGWHLHLVNKANIFSLENICEIYFKYINGDNINEYFKSDQKDIFEYMTLQMQEMKKFQLDKELDYLKVMKKNNFFFEKCIDKQIDPIIFNNLFYKLYYFYFVYFIFVLHYSKNRNEIMNKILDDYLRLGYLTSSTKAGSINRIYSLNYLDFAYAIDKNNNFIKDDATNKQKIFYPHGTLKINKNMLYNIKLKSLIEDSLPNEYIKTMPIILANNGITKFYISILFNWFHLEFDKKNYDTKMKIYYGTYMGYLNIFSNETEFHFKQDVHFWGISFTKNDMYEKNEKYMKYLFLVTKNKWYQNVNISIKRLIKLNLIDLKNKDLINMLDDYKYKLLNYYDSMLLIFIKQYLVKSKKNVYIYYYNEVDKLNIISALRDFDIDENNERIILQQSECMLKNID